MWTWLIGRVISASVQYGLQDLVFEVTANMIRQILDRGAAGTFSELLDAFPREGETEPRLSGTFTQAWNLAEFLRTAYQDYLGLYPDISLQILSLRPSLPVALGMVESSIPFGSDRIRITLRRDDEKAEVVLTPEILTERLAIKLVFGPAGKDPFEIETVLTPGDPVTIYIGADSVSVRRSDIPMSVESRQLTGSRERFSLNNASLAVPEWRDYWTSLKQPEYVMLPHSAVKQSPGENAIVLYDREDPVFDDSGPHGTYTYPTNPHFRDGILDIVRFTVKYDEENCYFSLRFRNLHDPGYHPEYGFQLTYAVVLIDRGTGEGGMGDAGANSFYLLTAEGGNFDRAVYVGGGIRVTDDGGNILSEYRPAPEDIVDPLGDIVEKEIRFSLPNEYLGRPSTVWRFLVLVGAQDDHGGAGIGVFRNIERTGGEWHGGGKMNPQDPNVYDTILPD